MFSKYLKTLSILKKFLFINFVIFTIIGLFTFIYLNNILEENKSLISHGRLKLDPSQLECEWNGKQLPDKLTTTEFLIVKELAKRPGIIKERAQLMDIAYREDTDIEDRTIDSHVKRIRKKFKKVDPDFSAIETRYGCLLYTSPSPRDSCASRMPSSA